MAPAEPVGPFVYVRFHGRGGSYAGSYPPQALGAWARRVVEWADAGLPAWVYFNNDVGGHALRNALTLKRIIERGVPA